MVVAKNLHLKELDVKITFLHGDLEQKIYMKQLEGFMVANKESFVCKLKNSLYDLKQALRQWYKKFNSFMSRNGFTRCQADHCCYMKNFDNIFIILRLYVDDILIVGSDLQEIKVGIIEVVCNERSRCCKADSWNEDQQGQSNGDFDVVTGRVHQVQHVEC